MGGERRRGLRRSPGDDGTSNAVQRRLAVLPSLELLHHQQRVRPGGEPVLRLRDALIGGRHRARTRRRGRRQPRTSPRRPGDRGRLHRRRGGFAPRVRGRRRATRGAGARRRVRSSSVSPPLGRLGVARGLAGARPCAPSFIFFEARAWSRSRARRRRPLHSRRVASFGAGSHAVCSQLTFDGKRTVVCDPVKSRSDGKRTVAVVPFAATEAAASSAPGGTSNDSAQLSSADLSSAASTLTVHRARRRRGEIVLATGAPVGRTASTTTSAESLGDPTAREAARASAPATAAAAAIETPRDASRPRARSIPREHFPRPGVTASPPTGVDATATSGTAIVAAPSTSACARPMAAAFSAATFAARSAARSAATSSVTELLGETGSGRGTALEAGPRRRSGGGLAHRRRLRVIVDVVVVREGAERGNRGAAAGRGDRTTARPSPRRGTRACGSAWRRSAPPKSSVSSAAEPPFTAADASASSSSSARAERPGTAAVMAPACRR